MVVTGHQSSFIQAEEKFTNVLFQGENGLWTNILTNNSTFFETSASAMFMMSLSRKISSIFYLKNSASMNKIKKIKNFKNVENR